MHLQLFYFLIISSKCLEKFSFGFRGILSWSEVLVSWTTNVLEALKSSFYETSRVLKLETWPQISESSQILSNPATNMYSCLVFKCLKTLCLMLFNVCFIVLTTPSFYFPALFSNLHESPSRDECCELAPAINTVILALDSCFQSVYTGSVPTK